MIRAFEAFIGAPVARCSDCGETEVLGHLCHFVVCAGKEVFAVTVGGEVIDGVQAAVQSLDVVATVAEALL